MMQKIKRDLRLGMTMDEREMAILDDLSSKQGMTRSGYIRYILQQLVVNGYVTANGWKEQKNG